MIFGASYCPYHKQTKALFTDNGLPCHAVDLDTAPGGGDLMDELQAHTGDDTVPQIFVHGQFLGGYGALLDVLDRGEWFEWYEPDRYAQALTEFDALMRGHGVLVIGGPHCPFCTKAQRWLRDQHVPFHYVDVDRDPAGTAYAVIAAKVSGQRTVPNIFVNGRHLGGYDRLLSEDFVSMYAAD